jgi:vitamin K-dependent gamma-carboxylase
MGAYATLARAGHTSKKKRTSCSGAITSGASGPDPMGRRRRKAALAAKPAAPRPAPPPAPVPAGWWPRIVHAAFAPVDNASIVLFRIAFGAVMAWEMYRYYKYGWISSYYIEPQFHFQYYGFGWVRPWPGQGMHIHFAVVALAALGVMAGLWYRVSAAVFFLGFTYVFLLEQAYYLNHFYLITLVSCLLVFIPAHRAWSLDAWRRPAWRSDSAPAWALWLLRLQVGLPYFFGGIAKLNGDWLRGEPIGSWLADRTDVPVIGRFLDHPWAGHAFAYGGLLLDLGIVPLLMWKRTRPWAFGAALAFHGLNSQLFDIGIFPWLMIAATLIFFEPDWPRRIGLLPKARGPRALETPGPLRAGLTVAAVAAWLTVQAVVPLRHLLYPGNVSWTEEGHYFSWHMKLRDKEGRVRFTMTDPSNGHTWEASPQAFLKRRQINKMVGHPDLVLQFAHYLAERGRQVGRPNLQVRVQAMASLNGREAQLMIDPDTDLAVQPRVMWPPATWILPLTQPLRTGARHESADVDE